MTTAAEPVSRPRKIHATYSGKCGACGTPIPVGALCWHLKHARKGRAVMCLKCGEHGTTDRTIADRKRYRAAQRKQMSNPPASPSPTGAGRRYNTEPGGTGPKPAGSAPGFGLPGAECVARTIARGTVLARWESLGALVRDACDLDTVANEDNRRSLEGAISQRSAWSSGVGLGNLAEVLRNPPTHRVGAVGSLRRELIDALPKPVSVGRRVTAGHKRGHRINARALLRGSPRPWSRRTQDAPVTRPVVRVGVNSGVLGFRSSDELFWRGAAAAALCEALERERYNVELCACACADSVVSGATIAQETVLKRAGERAPLSVLCFTLADVGFHRSAQIGIRYRLAHDCVPGGGSTRTMPDAVRDRYDVVFDSDILDKDSAIAAVKRAVRAVRDLGAM
jgi:hypothetical protein